MAYSTQRVVSDGSLVLLDISIDYFDRDEITVLFDGILDALPWEWVGSTENKISFDPAVPDGVEVLLRRNTALDAPLHQFNLGAAFRNVTLDENFSQMLRIAQEAKEGSGVGELFNNLDMHGYKIQNVGTAVDPTDVVSYAQFTSHDATIVSYRDSAASSAAAASVSAVAAASSASAASASATAASSAATSVLSAREPFLLSRANHTGTQSISSVSGLQSALDSKVGQTASTGSAVLPVGTTLQRDAVPAAGYLRFNSLLNQFEGFNGTAWGAVGGGATGAPGNAAFYENDQTVAADYSITSGKNAMTAGPIAINVGVTVTVPIGATWTVV